MAYGVVFLYSTTIMLGSDPALEEMCLQWLSRQVDALALHIPAVSPSQTHGHEDMSGN